jgi:glutamyl-tRNA synthetase/glutamyl-Q tRNA(Asp) synthetase
LGTRIGQSSIVTRFAPAPTGHLHLGHIVNAIYVWGVARACDEKSRVLLRIEDHDRHRSRRAFESAILEDLAWLGFIADGPVVRQSERAALYEAALDQLRQRGLVYACGCSRSEIAAGGGQASDGVQADGDVGNGFQAARDAGDGLQAVPSELRYPGTCAGKRLPESKGVGVRVRLEPTVERFDDWRLGPQEQRPSEQCGDLLARDREGNWTYQFAAVVDDWLQGVTLVIRGDDLLASTGRQIQLARMLGRGDPPAFLHHSLVMKTPTQKLSKSDGDSGIRDLRFKGWTAERVIGHAAALAGLVNVARPLGAEDVAGLFDIRTLRFRGVEP